MATINAYSTLGIKRKVLEPPRAESATVALGTSLTKPVCDRTVLANDRIADLMNATPHQGILPLHPIRLSRQKRACARVVLSLFLLVFMIGLTACGRSPTSRLDQARRLIDDGESAKAVEILNGVIREEPEGCYSAGS